MPSSNRPNVEWIDGPPAWVTAAFLAFLIGIVYLPALHAPLIYDDFGAITTNESITSLWPLIAARPNHGPLNPTPNLPTAGRPLVNFSFAVNRFVLGDSPAGYHVVSIVLHFVTAMFLWAITRRTLLLPYFGGRFAESAGWLALAVAGIWALHPLQTEAVIYATQRTELMMAVFYLGTLYCSLRYWTASGELSRRNAWRAAAVVCCLLGMASKEVMASAPLIVLLFDRAFISGSLWKAVRNSLPLYCGLAATWILIIATHLKSPHSDSAGFDLGVPAHAWWMTQAEVVFMYLKLVIWPWPLQIHYQVPYLNRVKSRINCDRGAW